jgi:hypothetical protein
MGIARTGMLTSPMLMLPDQVGWLGMGSRLSPSLPLCTSSGGFNLGIQIEGIRKDKYQWFSLDAEAD